MTGALPIIGGIVAGAIIWYIWMRPWQRRQYEKELERRRRHG